MIYFLKSVYFNHPIQTNRQISEAELWLENKQTHSFYDFAQNFLKFNCLLSKLAGIKKLNVRGNTK